MKKIIKKNIIGIIFFVFIIFSIIILNIQKNDRTDILTSDVFKTKAYTYLPDEAYNYVIDVYNKTGVILRTEKNKVENEPYLNPNYVSYLTNDKKTSNIPNSLITDYNYKGLVGNVENLPSIYDSRNVNGKNYVTSIKNQKLYDLCWDFSLLSVLETKLIKSGLYNSNDIDLSERQIDYATANQSEAIDVKINPYIINYENYKLTGSGNDFRFFNAISNGIAPVTETKFNFPYETSGKKSPEEVWNFENVDYDVDGYTSFPNDSSYDYSNGKSSEEFINQIKESVINDGSVNVLMHSSYGSYIQYDNTGDSLIPNTQSMIKLYYNHYNSGSIVDHAITIIGWDDSYERKICICDNFKISAALSSCESKKTIKGAWLTKNSHGMYSYLAYDTFGGEYSTINSVSIKNWDNVYTLNQSKYYNLEYKSSTGKLVKTATYSKFENEEKIEKIKFETFASNTSANIFINNTKVGMVNINYPGIYTLDLSDSDVIISDSEFSVSVRLNNIESDSFNQLSIFTTNNNNDVLMEFDDTSSYYNVDILDYSDEYLVVASGISRNLKRDNLIEYKIYDSSNNDITTKFNIYRNYSISNYIHTIIGYGDDIVSGNYNVDVLYNNKVYDNFNLYVDKDYVPIESISLNKNSLSMKTGEKERLIVTITPSNASDKNIYWFSSDDSVATVDEDGNVTAISKGYATIGVQNIYGDIIDTCIVEVSDNISENTSTNSTTTTTSTTTTVIQNECNISQEERKVGDINCDGKISNSDTVKLYGYIRKTIIVKDENIELIYDINKDGKVTISDVAKLHMYNMKKIDKL